MQLHMTLLALTTLSRVADATSARAAVWPQPAEQHLTSGGSVRVARGFSFRLGGALSSTGGELASSVVKDAVSRFSTWRTSSCEAGGATSLVRNGTITARKIVPLVGADESYTLRVEASGVTIDAATQWGALHALSSLWWLTTADASGCASVAGAPLSLVDKPRFAHRGVMLDPNRAFLPMGLLEKVVDGLALLKLNTLHLDLLNANDFIFRSASHPELWQHGALDLNETYTPTAHTVPALPTALRTQCSPPAAHRVRYRYTVESLASLVSYAAKRGVTVVYEMDTPGHSASWGHGQPDLVVCNSIEEQRSTNCPEPPCGYLDMASTSATQVATDVLSEVLALSRGSAVAPLLGPDAPVHLGADEVSDSCFGAEHTKPLFGSWVGGMYTHARKSGARVTVWAEAVTAMHAPLAPNATTLQLWANGQEEVVAALEEGYSLIYSNASCVAARTRT
jgi:hexosaminidase